MTLLESINPATGEVIARHETDTPAQVELVLDQADAAFAAWRRTPLDVRAACLRALGRGLAAHRRTYAETISLEMGKPIVESLAEIDKCVVTCEHFADRAADYLEADQVPTAAAESYVAFEPLGVILAVMPWNFPFWQVIRFLAPSLMAGNAAVLKHASNVTLCARALGQAIRDAGLPDGLVGVLVVRGEDVLPLVEDRRIRAVTLTGSSETGRLLAARAGAAIKKSVLELGGSDPFIVLRDADLLAAADTAARARFLNTGQTCIAAKRLLVEADVADEFERLLTEAIRRLPVGDPLDEQTRVGPLARADLRATVADQVERSIAMGAHLLLGGRPIDGPGWFYQPTLLTEVTPEMPVAREETFGPVAALIRAADASEAIQIANDTPFGLSAAIWTRNVAAAKAMAKELESGAVFVNGMTVSDPRLPFGGVKQSGYGRELSAHGIREFVNIQTVWIGPSGPASSGATS